MRGTVVNELLSTVQQDNSYLLFLLADCWLLFVGCLFICKWKGGDKPLLEVANDAKADNPPRAEGKRRLDPEHRKQQRQDLRDEVSGASWGSVGTRLD